MTNPDLIQALRQMVNALQPGAPVVIVREWAEQLLDAAEANARESVTSLRACPPEGWTLEEIGRFVGRSRKTIWEWVARGELHAEKFNEREYRVYEPAWNAFLAGRRTSAPAPESAPRPPEQSGPGATPCRATSSRSQKRVRLEAKASAAVEATTFDLSAWRRIA